MELRGYAEQNYIDSYNRFCYYLCMKTQKQIGELKVKDADVVELVEHIFRRTGAGNATASALGRIATVLYDTASYADDQAECIAINKAADHVLKAYKELARSRKARQ
jgi:hypothetical protein